jgi:hypothetical protein
VGNRVTKDRSVKKGEDELCYVCIISNTCKNQCLKCSSSQDLQSGSIFAASEQLTGLKGVSIKTEKLQSGRWLALRKG